LLALSRVALITGASRGIGAATAKSFAEAGWDLQLLARSSQELNAVADHCRSHGVRVTSRCVDFADPGAIAPALEHLVAEAGTPGLVINNAGVALTAQLTSTSLEQWQWLLQLNLTSVFQVCLALVPAMRTQGGGLIINLNRHAARRSFPEWGAYCTSKAALEAFSRCLAEEERGHGIRVSTLTLGAVNSPLWDTPTVQASFDRDAMLPVEHVASTLLHMAQQPPQLLLEDLTLMPAAGAL
jgi:NADP-dependent 3-hydroxy acid dehydrogenase YdfG